MLTHGDKARTQRHSPCPPASARWPGRSPRSLCGACISGNLLWKTSLLGRECSHNPHLWCHSHRTGQERGQRTQVSTGSHLPGPNLQSLGTPRDGHTRPIRHWDASGALGTDVLGTTCRATQSMVTIPHEGPGAVVWQPGRGPYHVWLLPRPTLGTLMAQPRGLVVVLILAAVVVFCSG